MRCNNEIPGIARAGICFDGMNYRARVLSHFPGDFCALPLLDNRDSVRHALYARARKKCGAHRWRAERGGENIEPGAESPRSCHGNVTLSFVPSGFCELTGSTRLDCLPACLLPAACLPCPVPRSTRHRRLLLDRPPTVSLLLAFPIRHKMSRL